MPFKYTFKDPALEEKLVKAFPNFRAIFDEENKYIDINRYSEVFIDLDTLFEDKRITGLLHIPSEEFNECKQTDYHKYCWNKYPCQDMPSNTDMLLKIISPTGSVSYDTCVSDDIPKHLKKRYESSVKYTVMVREIPE